MQSSLISITDILNSLKIDYCLIGGFAVAIHGVPRFTDDLDFLVHPDIKNINSELEILIKEKNGTVNFIKADLNDPLGDVFQITLNDNQIDLITAKTPLDFTALTRARSEIFQSIPLNIVSAEDLILLKLNAGGPQDLYDVAGILQVSFNKLDFSYMESNINNRYLRKKWSTAKKMAPKSS